MDTFCDSDASDYDDPDKYFYQYDSDAPDYDDPDKYFYHYEDNPVPVDLLLSSYMDPLEREFNSSDFDTHPELTFLTTQSRYFNTRIPIRKDGNPRGKYPRKPLPWSASKLSDVVSWEWDAEQYRIRLWRWEEKQRNGQEKQHESIPDTPEESTTYPQYFPNTACGFKKGPEQPKPARGPNTTNKHHQPKKKQTRKQRMKARKRNSDLKAKSKSKPTFPKPHYLAALDAMHRKQGHQRYWVGCPICSKIESEWNSEMKRKTRDLQVQRRDGLSEVDNGYDLEPLDSHFQVVESTPGAGGCWVDHDHDCVACSGYLYRLLQYPDLDDMYDPFDFDMRGIIERCDSLGERAYRVKYVARTGKKCDEENRDEILSPRVLLPEKEEVVCNPVMETSEEYEGLDKESIFGGSAWTNITGDDLEPSREADDAINNTKEEKSGWTINFLLGRWFRNT